MARNNNNNKARCISSAGNISSNLATNGNSVGFVKHHTVTLQPNNSGMVHCRFFHALLWVLENKKQNLCCQQGRVKLPAVQATPPELEKLLSESAHFRNGIRIYNSMLSFTSTGTKVDYTVTGTPGPYTYRIHGQNHHNIGSLLPEEGKTPSFLQLYIYDTRNEIKNRMKKIGGTGKDQAISVDILCNIRVPSFLAF